MTKKKADPKHGWVSPGGPPAGVEDAAKQTDQRRKIQKHRRKLEQAAGEKASDDLGLPDEEASDFQRAFEERLSFYWISLDSRAASPPTPEQVRVELRQLVERVKLAYRSVNEMSEPVRQALLSECLILYPELGPLRPLLDNVGRRLRQVHAMAESALAKVEVKPGRKADESLTILINCLAEEFSGKQLHANDYRQDPSFTGEAGANPEFQFRGGGHLFVARCLSWLEVNANAGTVASVIKQIVDGRRRSKKVE